MAAPGEGYGGVGGKFQKKPLRRSQRTPYDRPPVAVRNLTNNGWLSKLVDPASKLISASAKMFLPSVFRKRLPPLLQPPPSLPPSEEFQEPADKLQELPSNSPKDLSADQGRDLTHKSDGNGISELEQILTQTSFTRSEIERLTELLHSRTIDLPLRDERKPSEANCSNPPSSYQRHEVFSFSPMQESREERNKLISSPVGSSRVAEVDIASAAELAKAYMGSRPSNVSSPSVLGLGSHTPRDDTSFRNDVLFPPKSPITSLVSKPDFRENGFVTPRSRGRSAMYNMARTPYSRPHPTSVPQQGTRSAGYGFTGPSLTPRGYEHGGQSGTKQLALKRSSSTLDEDVGSVGPLRRIRQKSNLSIQDTSKYKIAKSAEIKGDSVIASTSYAQRVPSRSSQVAAKILEHLERMTPTEKSSESKQIFNKSPTKLTPDMLSGQALKSLGDVDSSKMFENSQRLSPDKVNLPNSSSLNQGKAEINGPKTSEVTGDAPNVALPPLQMKQAFQMSAHEDAKEADSHMYSNGFGFKAAKEGEGDGKQNKAAAFVSSGASSELLTKAPVPVVEADKASPPVKSAAGFMFATSSTQASHISHSTISSADKVVPPTDSNAASTLFTAVSKSADVKLPPFSFSSASPLTFSAGSPFSFSSASANANELSSPKPGFQLDPKPESSKSVANIFSGVSDGQPKILEADKKTQNAGDLKRSAETSPFSTAAKTVTFSSSSTGGENSNPNNGSSPSKFSVFTSTGPLIASGNTSKKRMVGDSPSFPNFTTSSSTTASVSSPFTAPPLFAFGSSSTASTTTTNVAKISDEKKVDATSIPTPTFGFNSASATSQPFLFSSAKSSGESMFSAASPISSSASKSSTVPFQFGGSSVFGASTSTSASTTTVSPLFGAPPAVSGSLFGSSAPSFGNTSSLPSSAASSASSASPSTFGSSWQTNPFASSSSSPVFSFGSSSSAATTPVSGLFGGSSSSAATTPVYGLFGGPSSAAAPVFSFTSPVATTPQQQQQPIFGSQATPLFSSPAISNGDQMSMEDSMAEDQPSVQQQPSPATPVFGGTPGFGFGGTPPSTSTPFQFGGQNTSSFQASGSLDFNAGAGGGSFSLGSNGGEKSGRRIVRASKTKNRKK